MQGLPSQHDIGDDGASGSGGVVHPLGRYLWNVFTAQRTDSSTCIVRSACDFAFCSFKAPGEATQLDALLYLADIFWPTVTEQCLLE